MNKLKDPNLWGWTPYVVILLVIFIAPLVSLLSVVLAGIIIYIAMAILFFGVIGYISSIIWIVKHRENK